MRRDDEALVSNLSARLSEEIENLPRDGKNRELTIKIKGNRGHINLGHQTFDIKTAKAPPPEGGDRARECPQCRHCTWRYTQLCMHCHYNLHRHDEVAEQEKDWAHKKRHNIQVLKAGVCCVGITGLSFFVMDYPLETLKPLALGLTGALGFFALTTMRSHR
ncbi:hypothetical protein SAMN03159443_01931 [Pseudomonas sp. NFACC15-1]|uniref:hypothetical protein n=1 Tax=unclassified Pseudomonas TaxID=196821 RepID=UPI0008923EAB|nr:MULTISPECIES: hypothetical protein [unclassified Pseudomonas]SDA63604.1 hypothetical protein SAMN03159443_01931 [Pseudomonas sp. NFACC15-1]SDX91313.1 hypothetical protein SAMN03159380_03080 [Pseudomonas sp. NFACC14]